MAEKNLAELDGVVAPRVLLNAVKTARLLTELGVRHALVGGLAVGIHGHPRATKDVDFLVADEAFLMVRPLLVYRDELKHLVEVGVVDLLSVSDQRPFMEEFLALPKAGGVPIIPVEALIMMKLDANRIQDRADVRALVDAGADVGAVKSFLEAHAANLVSRFSSVLDA